MFSPAKRGGIRSGILIVRSPRTGRKHITCNVNYSGPRRALGSFSDDDGDGYENVKKAKGLSSKTTISHVPHALIFAHSLSMEMKGFVAIIQFSPCNLVMVKRYKYQNQFEMSL